MGVLQPRTTLPQAIYDTDIQHGLGTISMPSNILPEVTASDTPSHSPAQQSVMFEMEAYIKIKTTSTGVHLNAKSEFPHRFKNGTIKTIIIYIYRRRVRVTM